MSTVDPTHPARRSGNRFEFEPEVSRTRHSEDHVSAPCRDNYYPDTQGRPTQVNLHAYTFRSIHYPWYRPWIDTYSMLRSDISNTPRPYAVQSVPHGRLMAFEPLPGWVLLRDQLQQLSLMDRRKICGDFLATMQHLSIIDICLPDLKLEGLKLKMTPNGPVTQILVDPFPYCFK